MKTTYFGSLRRLFKQFCGGCIKKASGTKRQASYPINEVFLERRSLYALSGKSLAHKQLMTLFEAAKWAPSEYNVQPWRFMYAHRDTPAWQKLFDLLVPFNQAWAKDAAVLVVVVSKKTFDNGKPSATHSFVTGAAWMNFVLEATMRGIVAHGIAGFDYAQARNVCKVPEDFAIEMMCVVGLPDHSGISEKELIQRDATPSLRKPFEEFVAEGTFLFSESVGENQP